VVLVDRSFVHLQGHIDQNKLPQITALQVKEKFGGLRFYVGPVNTEQFAVISFAESMSYSICEQCGSIKDIGTTSGWVSTLCRDCAEKRGKLDAWTLCE
jgi:hypothetical protein